MWNSNAPTAYCNGWSGVVGDGCYFSNMMFSCLSFGQRKWILRKVKNPFCNKACSATSNNKNRVALEEPATKQVTCEDCSVVFEASKHSSGTRCDECRLKRHRDKYRETNPVHRSDVSISLLPPQQGSELVEQLQFKKPRVLKPLGIIKKCVKCQAEFEPVTVNKIYCSPACRLDRTDRKCTICGTEIPSSN